MSRLFCRGLTDNLMVFDAAYSKDKLLSEPQGDEKMDTIVQLITEVIGNKAVSHTTKTVTN